MSSPAGRWRLSPEPEGRERLVVDGLNVIGSRPDGWWRDRRAAMRALADALGAYAAATGADVTVVFDGREFELESPGVNVLFAPARGAGAADDAIVAGLSADAAPTEVTVVTSDAGLRARVEALGGRVVAARGFRRRLDELAAGSG